MSFGEWLLLIFSGGFFLLMLFALVAFVVRIFKEAKPHQRKL